MPLLTTTERHAARLAADAESIAGFLAACIAKANAMTAATLAMSNADLTEWLNAKPAEQRLQEFGGHGILGEALNAAISVAEINLGEAAGSRGRVDVRSVPEKLAEQYRSIDWGSGQFVLADLPRPEPEPTPDPEP